jgi:MFS family permease
MQRMFKSTWVRIALGTLGWPLLAGYLVLTGDWRLSPVWALAFPAISFSVAWLFIGLKLFDRFPSLNRYLLYSETDETRPTAVSNDDWALKQAHYLNSQFRAKAVLSTPAEDGLICVPVLLVGIGPFSAALGGVVFGFLHLGRFTYLECIGKSITYAAVCYFVLPHGVLTVVLGHVITNGIGFVVVQIARRKLSEKLRSNSTVETDARESSARGSP